MGKIKRERQKFHITSTEVKVPTTRPSPKPKSVLPMQLDAVENIFAGINIQLDSINKFEPEPVVEEEKKEVEPIDEETSKPLIEKDASKSKAEVSEKHLTKKEKMKLKHEKLMAKLDVVAQARLQSLKKKQKNKLKPADQSLLPTTSAMKSLLTPAAVRPQPTPTGSSSESKPKNVFAIPTFNDDLPALNPVFKSSGFKGTFEKKEKSNKIIKSSKGIGKNKNQPKPNFVKNCNLLKKLMAKKRFES